MTSIDIEVGGKRLIIETGIMARQADGSAVVRYGDTVVLATAVAEKTAKPGIDFFPLTVDYQEKAYAAGKIPGGFFKREGRPSEKEILTSRLIDRPIRPLFPKGFTSETQGIVNVLSFGEENVSDVLGIIGVSAAMMISDIPFNGPVGAVRVGKVDGKLVVNPDLSMSDRFELEIIVAGTDEAILMVEGGAREVSEEEILEAIDFSREPIRLICGVQRQMREKVGNAKRPLIAASEIEPALREKIKAYVFDRISEAVRIPGKLKRQETLDLIMQEAQGHFNGLEGKDMNREVAEVFFDVEKKLVREMILEGRRTDGRRPDEVREIRSQIGFLPRAHGSALFIRGETQALVAATLGTSEDEQKIDSLEGESYKTFMLHYNFPPFSVGEVRFLRGPGRREIGHGALAERGLRPVIPVKEAFPYTIRVVSDILESNGSSSMATVCGASLALMDAGVPITAPVAGIAMGLVVEGERSVILTDILGLEDHLGDMDFKVTGTEKGITAFQLDSKIGGISREVMQKAIEQAKAGRLFILKKFKETIEEPKKELAPYAPRIYTMHIKPEKIREVIGTGGKVIRSIVEQTGVKIDIEDSGVINIASTDEASARKAIEIIEGIIEEVELGRIYEGKVVRITDFGAFVEILPGTDGLLHISQISPTRIDKVTDVLKVGDIVPVKVIEIDKTGKIRLSRKEAMKEQPSGSDLARQS